MSISIKKSITVTSIILFIWTVLCYAIPDLTHPAELRGLQTMVLLILFGSPLAISLLIVNLLIVTKSRIRDSKLLSNFEYLLLFLLFVSIFLHGLAMFMLSSSNFSSATRETLELENSFLHIASFAMIVLFFVCFVSFSIARFKLFYKYRWILSMLFCVLASIVCIAVYSAQIKHNNNEKMENNDIIVSSDIEVLAEAVVEFYQKNNTFPSDLRAAFDSLEDVGANFAYNHSQKISKRLHKYPYAIKDESHFEICGIFSKKSAGDRYLTQDNKIQQKPYIHGVGKVCFEYSKDDINHETEIEY